MSHKGSLPPKAKFDSEAFMRSLDDLAFSSKAPNKVTMRRKFAEQLERVPPEHRVKAKRAMIRLSYWYELVGKALARAGLNEPDEKKERSRK